ncbi:phBC6A51 family helix-turn-helix protein [Staphylococcus haemolyticus]|uniref:phBC6A51 family helix-turn-helix protein n=1 Tax=Staphylococcus haemolyticus TaxID=1283 RepID=UPI00069DCCF4|nr:phBC6A51 family helix-turn-helix protein [Staphylococcus haemolyticus]MBW5900663.1 helix-turn-helix domain-containing protein [Staphylococcus haemolyticus]MCH4385330.1 helix-turn-helix domain-containing protein [Staphylococcus haemolyticus]
MLTSKQNKAIALMVEKNLNQNEIARELNVARQTISNWKRNAEFQEELLNAERNLLKGLTGKAIKTMEDLLTAKSELVRYNAASDILDRTGHKPTDKVEAEVVTPTFVSDVPADD